MPRCENCAKMVSLETQDPEVDGDVEISDNTVSVTVTMVRQCADCNSDLKSAQFDLSGDLEQKEGPEECPDHGDGKHVWEVDGDPELSFSESGGGRYKKNMIGPQVEIEATCSCGAKASVTLSDELQASAWDDA